MEEDCISIHKHSSKDKIHLIRVPKGFDISKLNGVELNPNQVLDVETQKVKNGVYTVYELGTFDRQNLDLNLVVKSGDKNIAGPSLRQTLCVNKTVRLDSTSENSSTNDTQSVVNGYVSFPDGLKQRFIPFGSGSAIKCAKKKKKKSKRKRADISDNDIHPPSKKRHKQQ